MSDFFDENDLFEGDLDDKDAAQFEDDSSASGSGDDSAKLRQFSREVESKMRFIQKNSNPMKERIAAVKWLGNSADPKAIPVLRAAHKNESDKKFRAAALYALGQFKALDDAVKREANQTFMEALGEERNAKILTRIENISLGKTGPGALSRLLRMVNGLLVIGLVILVGLNVMTLLDTGAEDEVSVEDPLAALFAQYASGEAGVIEDPVAFELLDNLRLSLVELRRAEAVLNREFTAIAGGTAATCPLEVSLPDEIQLTPEQQAVYFEITDIATAHRIARTSLADALAIHNTACEAARQPTPEEVAAAQEALSIASTRLGSIADQIRSRLERSVATFTPESPDLVEGTAEVTADTSVVEETPEPTPGLSNSQRRTYVRDLLAIISEVNAIDGANTLLASYWRDVENAGVTGGCTQPRPTIPELDAAVPADITAAGETALADAWTQIHDALELLRSGWDFFQSACQSPDTLPSQLSVGRNIVDTAGTLLTNANRALTQLR